MHCIYAWRWISGRIRRFRSGRTFKPPTRLLSTSLEEEQEPEMAQV